MSDRAERLREVVLLAWLAPDIELPDTGDPKADLGHMLAPTFRAICKALGLDGECVCFAPGDMDAKRNPMVTPDYETHVARAILTLLEAGGTDDA